MSPQIIRQEKYTGLTDMWSLGVTFYFMMFKKLPWMAVHPVKILNEITIKINNGLVLPEENVSVVVSRLIERMLVIEEDGRLKWDELYECEDIAKYRHSVIEDFDENLDESTFETE
jgi:serine/threonine protein kinase